LKVTVSTLKPTVGMVVTSEFSFSLYRIAIATIHQRPDWSGVAGHGD